MHEPESKADWRILCELASKEQDPEKLMVLIRKLNQALDEMFEQRGSKRATPKGCAALLGEPAELARLSLCSSSIARLRRRG